MEDMETSDMKASQTEYRCTMNIKSNDTLTDWIKDKTDHLLPEYFRRYMHHGPY